MNSYVDRYQGLGFLDMFPDFVNKAYVQITDNFYGRLNRKSTETIVRYHNVVKPKGVFNRICFFFNPYRRVRYAALKRVIKERCLEDRV